MKLSKIFLLMQFKIPLLITIAFFLLQAFISFNRFGILSVVEDTALDFKKTNEQDIHLLKNQKAAATFKASENNLGIILIRLVKFGQGGDRVIFRIKKEGEEKWYHESKFFADQVQNNQYFPLGFPPIVNSKNNIYVIELESLAGEYNSGVGVIKDKPTAAVMYKYSVGDLKNYRTLLSFTNKKFLYVFRNIDYLHIVGVFAISYFLAFFIKRFFINLRRIFKVIINIIPSTSIKYLQAFKTSSRRTFKVIIHGMKSNYLSLEEKIFNFAKIINHWFTSIKFYLPFLNTNTKKRVAVGLLIFLLALTYRFSTSLVFPDSLFYYALGGQGDYDQFIRTATCALNFCSGILGQNFLFESSILGIFYKIFGFTGALKAYLYLMITLSSIVAIFPYLILSRKSWISIGGIIGSLYLATSDFLTKVSLNFPPDNSSSFIFSIFFIVYFLTLQKGTVRWLLFFGLVGTIDGLNKALFLINDLAAFALFVPVFFYEKVREANGSLFKKKNIKILLLSSLPLLVFLIIYIGWEYLVYIKFSAVYFLRLLLETGGSSYVTYTPFKDSSLETNIIFQLFFYSSSAIILIKRLIENAGLQVIFLVPIFVGMLYFSFAKTKFLIKRLIFMLLFSVVIIMLLAMIKNNYFKIHEIFAGEYIIDSWIDQTYIKIFLFSEIIILFILNFKYSALKLFLPILPYSIMLIFLAKNAPDARLYTHVVVWSIILLAYIINWILLNVNKHSILRIKGIIFGPLFLIIFILFYIYPKTGIMVTQLNSGLTFNKNEVRYLKWVNSELPQNAVILAGGKSDLLTLAENVKRPTIYNSLYGAALLIMPNEIPGVKPVDFSIIPELKNKDNFKKNKYTILEDDISIWRGRVAGVDDSVFAASSKTLLHADDYSIKVYKFNPTLKKAIYELNIMDPSVN